MLEHGLQPGDVLCDIGCGALRGGRLLIEYLDRGNYLGLDGEGELVELGLRHELDPRVREDKAPEFVISPRDRPLSALRVLLRVGAADPELSESHPQLAFYYTREQMQRMGHDAGWTPTFLGEWGSPAGQLMVRFTKE